MGNGKKIDLSNAKIKEDNGNLVIVERDEVDDTVEIESYNLMDELKKFENVDRLKFIIKASKPRNTKQRATVYKYKCSCGLEIKSKEENLEIKCLKCNEVFTKVEE